MLSLLCESAGFLSTKRGPAAEPCTVLVSEGGDAAKSLYVYQRWLPLLLSIHGEHCRATC